MVHSDVYLNKYVVSIAPFSTPAFTPPPFRTALFCMFSLFNFSSIFPGGGSAAMCGRSCWGGRGRRKSTFRKPARSILSFVVTDTDIRRQLICSLGHGLCPYCSAKVSSALHASGIAKSSTGFGWAKAGWQATVCGEHGMRVPVAARSGCITPANLYTALTYF